MKRRMTPKEFLSMGRRIDQRIAWKMEERARIESRLTSARGSNLSGMPRGGKYDWTDTVAKVIELTDEINVEIQHLCKVKQLINDAINAVEDERYRSLLELRYRHYMTFEQIADEMNYTMRYVQQMHGDALQCVKVPDDFA